MLQASAVADDYLLRRADSKELIEQIDGTRYRFRHAMYRDVAYEGLPFKKFRRCLHERTGRLMESELDDPTQIASLLSLHFAAAGRHSEAYRYATLAATDAARVCTRRAIEQYERALRGALLRRRRLGKPENSLAGAARSVQGVQR